MNIRAEESETVSAFEDLSLIELIVKRGPEAIEALPDGIKKNAGAVAETIENNVRKLIIDESPINPKYYEKMSELLDALIKQRRQGAISYAAYLAKIVELTKQAKQGPAGEAYPKSLSTAARRALYDNLLKNEALPVQVDRKDIKNLHLGVYPPTGRVRVAAPLRVSDDAVRLAVISKLGWIKRQQAKFEARPRQSAREMVSGESHYFLGRRYRLRVLEAEGPPTIRLRGRFIELQVRPGQSKAQRELVLDQWYRQQIKLLIPPMVDKWQKILGVSLAEWGVKKMKTRWGTCNTVARRIWLNLELAKKPLACLEYIIVHELAHLLVRHHDERFVALMNRHLPQWQAHRTSLNASPLAHSSWNY